MIKALHLASPNRNVGDNLLIHGVHAMFQSVFDFTLKPLNSIVITPEFIENEINTKKALFIGGGGLLHRSPGYIRKGQDWSGTLIRMKPEYLDLIKVPIIVYGIGYNTFNGELDLNDNSRTFIRKLIRKSVHFSVRNDGSLDRLNSLLGSGTEEVFEVPDPGTKAGWVLSKPHVNTKPMIVFQLAADRLSYRMGGDSSFLLVKRLREVVKQLPEGIEVRFMPHTKDDKVFMELNKFSPMMLRTDFQDSKKVLDFYRKSDIVVSMRGHGVICPFSIGVPTIGLSSHPKIDGWFKAVGFPKYSLSLLDKSFGLKLNALINHILGHRAMIFSRQLESIQAMNDRTMKVVRRIDETMRNL